MDRMQHAVAIIALCMAGAAAAQGFEQPQVLLPNVRVTSVAVGDISGDGRPDVVIIRPRESPDTELLLFAVQQSDGTVAAPVPYPISSDMQGGARSVDIIDFDEDGDQDIIVARSDGGFAVLRNDGGLQFSRQVAPWSVSMGAPAFDDIDGDGHLDIVASTDAGPDAMGIVVFRGNGTGGIGSAGALDIARARSIALVDVEGDGDLDLARVVPGEVQFHERTANGFSAVARRWPLGTAQPTEVVAFADADADGRVDVLSLGPESNPDGMSALRMLRQVSRWEFRNAPTLRRVFAGGKMIVADANGDGGKDIVTGQSQVLGLMLRTPSEFAVEKTFRADGGFDVMRLADFDGDGRLDVFAPRSGSFGVVFLRRRQSEPGPDVAAYLGLSRGAVALRIQNNGAVEATGQIRAYINLEFLKRSTLQGMTAPQGCTLVPQGSNASLYCLNVPSLEPGASTTLVLTFDPNLTRTDYLCARASVDGSSISGRESNVHNNNSTARLTIWPLRPKHPVGNPVSQRRIPR